MKPEAADDGLPIAYNDNYLVLLPRDPHCFFAYWELVEPQMAVITHKLGCDWGNVTLILRVYDLTGLNFDGQNAHRYFDLQVHPLANNYYVKDIEANSSYCVDLGVMMPEGHFVSLLRSNLVHTSRDSLADGTGTVMADLLDRTNPGGQMASQSDLDLGNQSGAEGGTKIRSFSSVSIYDHPGVHPNLEHEDKEG